MLPEEVQQLLRHFAALPGVGPRQAARFVFSLLSMQESDVEAFGKALAKLRSAVGQCERCYFLREKKKGPLCNICDDASRDQQSVCVIEKETDLLSLEKTRAFKGVYHVLGSLYLESKSGKSPFRLEELLSRVEKLGSDKKKIEVVLAFNPTTEGDATAHYLAQELSKLKTKLPGLSVSRLGRGLSTGSELEYADAETIKSALERRS